MVETLLRDPAWRIEALVTTVNETNGRVAMHGTPKTLLQAQADALGMPLTVIGLPENCDNKTYETRLADGLRPFRQRGIETIACGDLFLEDIRHWREDSFRGMGWEVVFPIWGTPTDHLARQLVREPWRVVVTCIDTHVLPERFLGATMDARFLNDLPASVDPCGENGEFHTFVCNAPAFEAEIPVARGETVPVHDRYRMIDLRH